MKRTILLASLVMLLTAGLATPANAQAGDTGAVYYTVQVKDTLYRIALRYGTTVRSLVHLNHIADPNRIYVGQVLLIRPGREARETVYIVRYGDTLGTIARRFGITIWRLAEINRIYNVDRIFVGQRLLIRY